MSYVFILFDVMNFSLNRKKITKVQNVSEQGFSKLSFLACLFKSFSIQKL